MVFAAALIVRVGCSSSLSPDRRPSFGVSPFRVKSVVKNVSFSLGKERFTPGRRFDRIVGPLWKNVGNIDQGFRLRNNVARCEMGSNLEDTSLNKKTVNSLSGGHFVDNLSAKDCCAARNVSPLNENGDSYAANPGGSSGDGEFPPRDGFGGNGGDGNDGSGKDDNPDEKVASLLKYEEVMKRAGSRGVKLPSDMCEAAKTVGIEKELFENYLNLQVFFMKFLKSSVFSHTFRFPLKGIGLASWCGNQVVSSAPGSNAYGSSIPFQNWRRGELS